MATTGTRKKMLKKRRRVLKKSDAAIRKFMRAVEEFMLDQTVECEPLDGKLDIRIRPLSSTEMTLSYTSVARYCCTCTAGDPKCGECTMARGAPGVIRDGPIYGDKTTVANFR